MKLKSASELQATEPEGPELGAEAEDARVEGTRLPRRPLLRPARPPAVAAGRPDLVAIAAVPFLLGDDSEQLRVRRPAGAEAPRQPPALELTVVESTPGLRDYRKRLRGVADRSLRAAIHQRAESVAAEEHGSPEAIASARAATGSKCRPLGSRRRARRPDSAAGSPPGRRWQRWRRRRKPRLSNSSSTCRSPAPKRPPTAARRWASRSSQGAGADPAAGQEGAGGHLDGGRPRRTTRPCSSSPTRSNRSTAIECVGRTPRHLRAARSRAGLPARARLWPRRSPLRDQGARSRRRSAAAGHGSSACAPRPRGDWLPPITSVSEAIALHSLKRGIRSHPPRFTR